MNSKQNRCNASRSFLLMCAGLAALVGETALAQQAVPAAAAAADKPQVAVPWSLAAPRGGFVFPGVPRPNATAASTGQKPGGEGISVHGHWVIDVRNPDGTLAQHRDFENSMVDFGNAMIGLLYGNYVAGDFGITLLPQTGASICGTSSCAIVESASTLYGAATCGSLACNSGLTTTVSSEVFTPPFPFSLSGQFVATQTGSVGSVFTGLGLCGARSAVPSATVPSTCSMQTYAGLPTNSIENFTGTTLTPIPVTAGQVVQVTVTLGFS